MKITKSYLRSLIQESLEEAGGYYDQGGEFHTIDSDEMPTKEEGNVYLVVDFSMDEIIYATLDEKTAKKVGMNEREQMSMNGIGGKIRVLELKMGTPVQKSLKKLPGADTKL